MPDLDLTVVDSTPDPALNRQRSLAPGAISSNSVIDMVNNIITALGTTGRIRSLRIIGHASRGLQAVGGGKDPESHESLVSYCNGSRGARCGRNGFHAARSQHCSGRLHLSSQLSRLRGHFAPGAIVELHGCQVAGGFGHRMLMALAQLWDVPVRAGQITQHVDPAFAREGVWIQANPNGTFTFIP